MATKKYINLLQSHEPLMDAGDYEITVEQTLGIGSKNINESFGLTRRKFSVFGERFFLEPGSVHAVYPPAGSKGEHSNTFPHIILNRSTLPWERSVDGRREGIWLALLLFDELETPEIKTITVGDFKKSLNFRPTPTVKTPGDNGPFHETGDGPDGQPVTVIDVKQELLQKIMPSRADLQFCAHSRRETDNAVRGSVQVTGPERAVVIGNRLPQANGLCTVHLVSLENRFSDGGGFDFSIKNSDGSIRLLSLKSWSFTSVAAKFNLFGMLEHLNRKPAVLARPYLNDQVLAPHLNLEVPDPDHPEKLLISETSGYGFALEFNGSKWMDDGFDNFRQFDEHSSIKIEVRDTSIDADKNAQLDPFPDPAAFTIAIELRMPGALETDRHAIMGKVEDGKYKPSLWYHPGIRGIEYRVSDEEGTLYTGLIPGMLQDKVFSRIVWLKEGSEFRFYEGGRLAHKAPAPGRIFTKDSPYFIGKVDEQTGVATGFSGQIKYINIFRRAISAAEVRDIFTSQAGINAPMVNDHLRRGFLPLPHQLRKGGRGISWYRGPLSVRTKNPGFNLPAVAADQLLVLDQTTGMWDVSYAAAWQLGRLMALEDRQFSLALFNWKRQMSMRAKQQGQKVHLPFRNRREERLPTVNLFLEKGFQGPKKTVIGNWTGLEEGEISMFNDNINSIEMDLPAGWEAVVFKHFNFEGDHKVVSGHWDAADDPDWANQINSIKIINQPKERIRDWLKKRHLLHDIPFHYLVPEAGMLPPESIRFFHVDPTWVACLKDGATSVGRTSSADFALDQQENLADEPVGEMSGFLLHSELVAGYPGLQILGFAQKLADADNPAEDSALPILRREKLSDNVLLCIFEGNLATVDFFQKPDVLHFGLDSDGEHFSKQLRKANGESLPENVPSFDLADLHFHEKNRRVLDFSKMATSLQKALGAALDEKEFEEFITFTSADFAMQMLEGAERVRFTAVTGA